MNIHEMHYDFKIKVDKVDSNIKRNFNQAQIDWLLREAEMMWLKTNYGLTNPKKVGFEGTEQRIQDLKALHIKSPEEQVGIVPTLVTTDIYRVELSSLTFEHMFTTRLRAKIRSNGCDKIVGISVVETDDLTDAMNDPFHKPNFKFGKVLAVYGKSALGNSTTNNPSGLGALYLYSDNFEIIEVYIDYIKYPNRMWIGTYDLTSNLRPKDVSNTYIYQASVDSPVNCELNGHVHNEIVDIAVMLAASLIEDPNLIQLKQAKILTNK